MNTSITKPNPAEDANLDARPVKDIIEPAKTVLGEVPVVTREKLLVGTTNLEAIAQDNDGEYPGTFW